MGVMRVVRMRMGVRVRGHPLMVVVAQGSLDQAERQHWSRLPSDT